MQHEVTLNIHFSDQHQQNITIISGNNRAAGMSMVQRHYLLTRDVECLTTARQHHRNEGMADLCSGQSYVPSKKVS